MALFRNKLIICGLVFLLTSTGCTRQTAPTLSQTSASQTSSEVAERANLEGKWDYTMTNPDQSPFSGIISVQRGGTAGYTGWISMSNINYEAPTAITKAELQGQNFIYAGEVKTLQGTFPFEMKGTIKGNKMEGQNKVQTENGPVVFKVTATRR